MTVSTFEEFREEGRGHGIMKAKAAARGMGPQGRGVRGADGKPGYAATESRRQKRKAQRKSTRSRRETARQVAKGVGRLVMAPAF